MQAPTTLQNISYKVKAYSIEWVISCLLNLLTEASDETLIKITYLLERLTRTEVKRETIQIVRSAFQSNHPVKDLARRLFRELHPNCKRGLLINFIVQSIFAEGTTRAAYRTRYGEPPPFVVLISPTMRCNLHCRGCYASQYNRASDLDPETLDRLLEECKEIGVNFITLVGGEPFIYEPTLEIFEDHRNVVFQVFTNGTMIDEKMAEKLAELGNVAPAISIEGFKEETDARRGPGTFDAIMRAMNHLREAGVLFFFSVCSTRHNYKVVVSDEFVDMLVEKGAALGWYFHYMPIGRDCDLSLMPTPEQRNYVRARVNHLRSRKPILLVDFWGDGPLVEGCLAGGKLYVHINNKGDVEPCIFCHFAVDNIKDKSLVEILNSDFFKAIRESQPFGHNDLRPCPLIDHPGAMAGLVEKYGAYPTHKGAESLFNEFIPHLREYAQNVAQIYKKVWDEEYKWVYEWRSGQSRKSTRNH